MPGTKTVELLGFCLTVATARSNEAFLSFKSFVCCASRRSWGYQKAINSCRRSKKARKVHTLFDNRRESRIFCVAFCKAQSEKFLPRRFSHERKSSQANLAPCRLWTHSPTRRIRHLPGRPAVQLTARALTAGPAQTSATYKWTIRFDSHSPPYFIVNHGPRPSKGTLYISSFNASNSSHPIRSQGYHSGRQWVSPFTYPDTFLSPPPRS